MIFGSYSSASNGKRTQQTVQVSKDIYIINGSSRLIDLAETPGIQLQTKAGETINAWLCEKLDRLPVKNDSVTENGWIFTVTKADKVRAVEISAQKIQEGEEPV